MKELIKPIKRITTADKNGNIIIQVNELDLRKLEQQRNELCDALIDTTIEIVNNDFCILKSESVIIDDVKLLAKAERMNHDKIDLLEKVTKLSWRKLNEQRK